jgi:hypothetical protein
MESIGKLITILTFTCIPILLMIGFLTNDEYRNPFVFIILLFFTGIGATIWVKSRKEKQK